MTDPRRPRPPRPTIPWTPFGPGDNANPDVDAIKKQAAGLQAELEKVRLQLTEMRYGPGPDGTRPEVREVTREDGFWPYLLIRSFPGDTGARPTNPDQIPELYLRVTSSPDIIVTPVRTTGPTVVDRAGYPALEQDSLAALVSDRESDIWVQVWNLGAFQATGVRVRVFEPENGPVDTPPYKYLGGTYVDLGDRLSDRAHLVVKAATWKPADPGYSYETMLIATAESITDPASGSFAIDSDRHTAHRLIPSMSS